jgi:hypothetical protein
MNVRGVLGFGAFAALFWWWFAGAENCNDGFAPRLDGCTQRVFYGIGALFFTVLAIRSLFEGSG